MHLNRKQEQLLRRLSTLSILQMEKRLAGEKVGLIDKKQIGEALAIAQGFLHLMNKQDEGELEQLKLDFNDDNQI